jgi:hypothetical protein
MRTNVLVRLVTVFLVVISTQTLLTTYTHFFDTISQYSPSYKLGLLSAGQTLTISATISPGAHSFDMTSLQVELSTDADPALGVSCSGGCATSSCMLTCNILTATFYKLAVVRPMTPADNSGNNPSGIQPMQIAVNSTVNSSSPQTLLKTT